MGIDVRAHMSNMDVKRAACVGCGLRHVRPRLSPRCPKLENKPDRFKGGTPIRVYAVDQ